MGTLSGRSDLVRDPHRPYTRLPAITIFYHRDDDTTDSVITPDTPPSHLLLIISPDLPSTFAGAHLARCVRYGPHGSSVIGVRLHLSTAVSRALSPVRADLIPSPKRVKDSGYLEGVEVDPREISLRDDATVRFRDIESSETETRCVKAPVEVRVERVTYPVMPEDIPEPAQEGAVEATYETLGDLVPRFHDHTQAIPVYHIQAIEEVQREQGHKIVGVESAVIALTERITELERDNKRLREQPPEC
ncbi:hypothetical protein Tco_1292772 [Tanacetum coccineum]